MAAAADWQFGNWATATAARPTCPNAASAAIVRANLYTFSPFTLRTVRGSLGVWPGTAIGPPKPSPAAYFPARKPSGSSRPLRSQISLRLRSSADRSGLRFGRPCGRPFGPPIARNGPGESIEGDV